MSTESIEEHSVNDSDIMRQIELTNELTVVKNQAKSQAEVIKDLREQLQQKGEECNKLQLALENSKKDFEKYKESMKDKFETYVKVHENQRDKVTDLKKLAEQDRTWLERETAKRKAVSEKIKCETNRILERRRASMNL